MTCSLRGRNTRHRQSRGLKEIELGVDGDMTQVESDLHMDFRIT